MQKVWILHTKPSAESEVKLPTMVELHFATDAAALAKTVKDDTHLLLLTPSEKISEAEKILDKKIMAIWPWSAEEEGAELLPFAIQSVLREAELHHDLEAAEFAAWSGSGAAVLDDLSIELVGQTVLDISACRDMEAVELELLQAANQISSVDAVKVVLVHEFRPAQILGKFQLAVPIQLQGVLLAHVYASFCHNISAEIEKVGTFFLSVGDVIALAIERNQMIFQQEQTKVVWEASFDAVDDPVAILNEDFSVLRANRAFGKLIHVPISKIQGKNCLVIEHEDLQAKLKKEVYEWDISYEGKVFRVFFDIILERLGAGFYVLRLHDVSSERALTEKILAREQIGEMGILVGSVAHEINNPVGGIIALSQVLLKELKDNDPLKEDLAEILKAGERCKKIVQTMLSLVRKSDEEKVDTDLVECIRLAKEIIDSETKRLNIRLLWNIAPNLESTIAANKNRLIQVFFHLLQQSMHAIVERKNSEKFSAELKISLHTTEKQVSVLLEDNGAAEIHVYDANSSVAFAVAKMIVEEHSGTIELHCQEKQNQVKIIFPLLDTVS